MRRVATNAGFVHGEVSWNWSWLSLAGRCGTRCAAGL